MILTRQQYDDLWISLKNAHARSKLLEERLALVEEEARELRALVTPLDPGLLPKRSNDR